MIIDRLPLLTNPTTGDEIPVERGQNCYKIDYSDLKGEQGPAGVGVPSGGTTGQVLAKTSATDYATAWVDASGGSGLTDDIKQALLAIAQHVAYTDDQGQVYYNALYEALYPDTYPRIGAVFNPGSNTIYVDEGLNALKQYMTVKLYEDATDTGTIIASSDYTLSGTLVDGENTVMVEYDGMTTSVQVEAVDFYNIHVCSIEDGSVSMIAATVDANQNDTTMYPSRITFNYKANRRTFHVMRGKAPYYYYNQTAVATPYYPVPIPLDATKVRISMVPSGRWIYINTVKYDEASNTYLDSIVENRVTWTELSSGVFEKVITNPGNLFMILNSKYDSAGSSYPSDPSSVTIEFLEA